MSSVQRAGINEEIRRFMVRAYSRAAIPYLITGILLILAVIIGGHEIEHHINAIESWVANMGSWSVVAFVGLFIVVTSFLFPDTVLCITAGALFGVYWGVVAVLVGSVLAGTLQFALAHKLLRTRIQHSLASRPSLAAIQSAVRRDEFRLQVLLRLTPLNPATVTYILGAAGVRFSGFLVALLAHTPNLAVEVYFGHVGKHAARLVGSDAHTAHIHDLVLMAGFAVCITVALVVSKMAKKAVMQAVTETEKSFGAEPSKNL